MNRRFSLAARGKGFVHAWRGVVYLIATQHNAWIHLFAAACVIAAGLYLELNRWEWAWLILAIGLVLAAEAMNTAIEALADALSPEFNAGIGRAKDVAAAAVLILALTAAAIGALVFLPHFGCL
ncbi:MAG: diacylglycerol kinase family protein [Pseudomonadota bacterium]|nr:diacylglycerol kinase family protein [Pseudomonadota bacterium]MDP1906105.1 diacylglycerol kinase family protein [Pseudomonadota bacterium]MDP2353181.1 diacylglycerol kinase family protein [Pseudomonadota bacterium]